MKIDCYLSLGCSSEVALIHNLNQALAEEGIETNVICHRINEEEAERLDLKGSPTILINGVDPFPSEIDGFS
jgi:hypothetical protein